jgi:nucleoside-diphosphate-sugar epimerase
MQANIPGMVNLYEAVHKLGIRRVVFASSKHTMGMYQTTDTVDAGMDKGRRRPAKGGLAAMPHHERAA